MKFTVAKIASPLFLLSTVALALFSNATIFAAQPPNVVLILIDDLGWADLPSYGNQFHETPAIDRLAKGGMRFTDFYAAAPVCSPARASLQSGQYPARLGLTDFVPGHWRPFERLIVPPIEDHLPLATQSLAETLKPAGYATGYFGKWHLGGSPRYHPSHQGFDQAITSGGRHVAPKFRTHPPTPVEDGTYLSDFLTTKTLEFIEENQSGPFFVFLSHYLVHIPLEAPPQLIEKYQNKTNPGNTPGHPVYAAMIEQVDHSVDQITRKLDELGLAENTIVIFTSENGGLHKIYTAVGETVTSNAPLRGEKGTLYEGGIRIPLIVRWPGKVSANTECNEPATTADILPTLADIAGTSTPDVDGASLVPVLTEASPALDRDAIYFHYPHYHHARPAGAIRQGRWKLLENFDDHSLELYNLDEDLGETNNLAKQLPDQANKLQQQLSSWRTSVGARMPTENPNYNAERKNEWWSRRLNKPLDLESMDRFFRSRHKVAITAKKKSPDANQQPNVVLIISDDQAWNDYGFMGHPQIATPRLDRLARESLVFPRGYVSTSLCCPSLATMITGLYPRQHMITGNDPTRPKGMNFRQAWQDPAYLALATQMDDYIESVPTLPRLLGEQGYLSHQSGKWWHGSFRRGGFTHGMTHGDPVRGGRHGDEGLKIGREGLAPIDNFLTLASDEEKPFFLWYAPFLPHRPHNPPERLLKKYRDKTDSIHLAKYWSMCEWFDETCGQLLDLLALHGMSDNTMVLYVCDNGWINLRDASGYAPRSKRSPHDGGLRTPIMIRWPGHVQPRRSNRLASSLDLAPTILAACGMKPTNAMPGINLLDRPATETRDQLFGNVYAHDIADLQNPDASLMYRWTIKGPWKLILPNLANAPDDHPELYNLLDDEYEKNNLATKNPGLVAKLTQAIEDHAPVRPPATTK